MDENYAIHNATTPTVAPTNPKKKANYEEAKVTPIKTAEELEAERVLAEAELERIANEKTLDYENHKELIIKALTNPLINKKVVAIAQDCLNTKDAKDFGSFYKMLTRLEKLIEDAQTDSKPIQTNEQPTNQLNLGE
jgi:hypothetical protein